jgi:hypothetical protein
MADTNTNDFGSTEDREMKEGRASHENDAIGETSEGTGEASDQSTEGEGNDSGSGSSEGENV